MRPSTIARGLAILAGAAGAAFLTHKVTTMGLYDDLGGMSQAERYAEALARGERKAEGAFVPEAVHQELVESLKREREQRESQAQALANKLQEVRAQRDDLARKLALTEEHVARLEEKLAKHERPRTTIWPAWLPPLLAVALPVAGVLLAALLVLVFLVVAGHRP